jgi:hypothetical protein
LTETDRYPGVVSLLELANIAVVVWTGQPTPAAVDRLFRATERRTREHSESFSVIHPVAGDITLPDTATRQAFVRLMKSSGSSLACVAVVVGGTGFWASTARSLITGMRVLERRNFRHAPTRDHPRSDRLATRETCGKSLTPRCTWELERDTAHNFRDTSCSECRYERHPRYRSWVS